MLDDRSLLRHCAVLPLSGSGRSSIFVEGASSHTPPSRKAVLASRHLGAFENLQLKYVIGWQIHRQAGFERSLLVDRRHLPGELEVFIALSYARRRPPSGS